MAKTLSKGQQISRQQFIKDLTELLYKRNEMEFVRGNFRVRGDNVDLFPAHMEDRAWRFAFFGDELESIYEFDPLTGEKGQRLRQRHRFRHTATTSHPSRPSSRRSSRSAPTSTSG